MDEWVDGEKEGKTQFSNSTVRTAFRNNWNKQPPTGVRNYGDQKSKHE